MDVFRPDGTDGGVVQYDFGKSTESRFMQTGALNRPNPLHLGPISKLEASHLRRESELHKYIRLHFRQDQEQPEVCTFGRRVGPSF